MEKENALPIVKNPGKVLRRISAEIPIARIGSFEIQNIISAMKKTLAATPDGVGLAAPQIGKSLAVFIVSEEAKEIDRTAADVARYQKHGTRGTMSPAHHAADQMQHRQRHDEKPYETREWKYDVFINPVVKNKSQKKLEGPEGCLSVPGKFGTVARHEKITVAAHDEHGKKFTRGASRFFARVMQHELDHLRGTLFTDKADDIFDADLKKDD